MTSSEGVLPQPIISMRTARETTGTVFDRAIVGCSVRFTSVWEG